MKTKYLLLCLFCISILLAGCTQIETTQPLVETMPVVDGMANYPAPLSTEAVSTSEGYPAPEGVKILQPGESPTAPDEAPKPEKGMASISGVLYSYPLQSLVPGTVFYLTPAVGDGNDQVPLVLVGPQDSRNDIRGESDNQGVVELNNIPPGNYYLVVWAPYNWVVAEVDGVSQQPLLITLEADQQAPLGVLYLSWP